MTKTDQVLQYLRQAVARGEIEPGQPVREHELAATLGVSRTPVREALRRAQITGLVQYAAYRGVTVTELSAADMVEIYRIRSRVEPLATELATPRLTEADLVELERLNGLLHRPGASVEQHRQANDAWHDCVYQAAGSPRLYGLINALLAGCPRDTFSLPGRVELSVHEHAQVLVALRHRNADLAARLMEGHILSAVASMLEAGAAAEQAA